MNFEKLVASEPVSFGQRLHELRKKRGLTLGDVADAVGVTKACVCQWERNRSMPRRTSLGRLALVLHTSTFYLTSGLEQDRFPNRGADMTPAEAILEARRDVARALGVDVAKVRIIID